MDITDTLSSLEAKVQELSQAQQQRDPPQIAQCVRLIVEAVDAIPNADQYSKTVKAKLAYFKGRALAASERYEKAAEELLSKSVRLDPRNAEAWSLLGEVFYFKKDYPQAKRCFEGSLEQSGPNKETLRKLSIVYRFLSQAEDRKDAVLKSIEIAKQALGFDLMDSESWYILANAHLTNYFTNSPSYEELEKSMRSYSQAERFAVAQNPDLYFNKAIALHAAQRYREAFEHLDTAKNLDQTLDVQGKSQEFYESLANIYSMVDKKCNMKNKEINTVCRSIPISMKSEESFEICSVLELAEGENKRKILSLKLLGYSKSEFPPIFIGCDSKKNFFAVSIYNYQMQNRIVLGCGVFIRDPIMQVVNVKGISYTSVQVRDPNLLMIQKP